MQLTYNEKIELINLETRKSNFFHWLTKAEKTRMKELQEKNMAPELHKSPYTPVPDVPKPIPSVRPSTQKFDLKDGNPKTIVPSRSAHKEEPKHKSSSYVAPVVAAVVAEEVVRHSSRSSSSDDSSSSSSWGSSSSSDSSSSWGSSDSGSSFDGGGSSSDW